MKFAIIRRNGLGDFISATVPVCNYIKDKFPNSELHLFLSEQNFALAKYFFPEDSVYVIHSGNKYLEAVKTALKYRNISPDIGIAPSPSYNRLNGVFLKLLGAEKIYGVREESVSLVEKFFTKLVTVSHGDHVGLQNIKLFEDGFNKVPEKYYPRFNKNSIKEHVPTPSEPLKIVIELSNHRKTSQLSNDRLAVILNSMSRRIRFSVIISLMEKDMEKALDLQNLLIMPSRVAITKTLDEYIALLNQAHIFLFGDGGGAHIAGALGKLGVAVYGKTSVRRWGVLSSKVKHLYDEEDVNNIDVGLIEESLLDVLSRDVSVS